MNPIVASVMPGDYAAAVQRDVLEAFPHAEITVAGYFVDLGLQRPEECVRIVVNATHKPIIYGFSIVSKDTAYRDGEGPDCQFGSLPVLIKYMKRLFLHPPEKEALDAKRAVEAAGFRVSTDLLGQPTLWCKECSRDSGMHQKGCSKS